MLNKNRNTASVIRRIMLCLLALLLFCLAGCGKNAEGPQSATEAFEVFINAQKTLDVDAMVSLTPTENYERYINSTMNRYAEDDYRHYSYEQAKEMADTWYGKDRILAYYWADDDSRWLEPGYITEVTYKITDRYDATKDEAAQLSNFIEEHLGYGFTVTDATLLYGSYTIHTEDGQERTIELRGEMCIEIDGRWYYINNTSYWCTFEGNKITEKVDWVYNWFAQYDNSLS